MWSDDGGASRPGAGASAVLLGPVHGRVRDLALRGVNDSSRRRSCSTRSGRSSSSSRRRPALRQELARRFGIVRHARRIAERAIAAEIAYYRAHLDEGGDAESLSALRARCAEVVRAALAAPSARRASPTAELTDALLASIRFSAFPDVRPASSAARARGARLVVVSNWDASLARRARAARADAAARRGRDLGSSAGARKTVGGDLRARRFQLAGTSPRRAIHVGDSLEEDVAGARAAGHRARPARRDGGAGPPGVRAIASLARAGRPTLKLPTMPSVPPPETVHQSTEPGPQSAPRSPAVRRAAVGHVDSAGRRRARVRRGRVRRPCIVGVLSRPRRLASRPSDAGGQRSSATRSSTSRSSPQRSTSPRCSGRPRPADFGFRRLALGACCQGVPARRLRLLRVHRRVRVAARAARQRQAAERARGQQEHRGARRGGGVRVRDRADGRGVLLPRLLLRRAQALAAGAVGGGDLTGLLFGLAHTGSASPQYLIPLGFLGFVLCLVRWRTGSLYPVHGAARDEQRTRARGQPAALERRRRRRL